MADPKIKVLYIAGYGRSGSTLLDVLFGQFPGFVSTGELGNAWGLGPGYSPLCGCGQPVNDCSFWKEVIEKTFDSPDEIEDLYRMREDTENKVSTLKAILPIRSGHLKRTLEEYSKLLLKLYRAIQEVSNAQFIVDSTKRPSYGKILGNMPGIELSVLHLVRDSRAVAYSWTRRRLRPEIHGSDQYAPTRGSLRSSAYWSLANVFAESLRRISPRYTLLRYEDFVAAPREELNKLCRWLGVPEAPLDFLNGDQPVANQNHTIHGNPMRLQQGGIQVRADTEWISKMSRPSRSIVTALTWPLLMRYGYPLK